MMDVRYRWRRTVLTYRLWCFNTSNMRYGFGDPNRRCCTLPDAGHFLIYMHYDEKWLCAVIDGASGYLDGYITRSTGRTNSDLRIRESNGRQKGRRYIQHAKKLPWDGGYYKAMFRKSGHQALVDSFLVLYAHVEAQQVPGPSRLEVIRAGETFIFHFAEAGRSDDLYMDNIFRNFRAENVMGKKPIEKAKQWKSSCATIYRALGIKNEEFSDNPKVMRGTYARKRVTTYSDAEDAMIALKDIRLLHRPNHKHGYFYLKNMPMHLSNEGPVDPKWGQNELRDSHELDLDSPNWGFLMEHFPVFPGLSNDGNTENLLKNAYIRNEEVLINKLVAYHESGHAIVALHTPGANPIHKVTVLPEGSSLGMVTQVASPGDASIGIEQLLARLDVCFGGRVAEELMFGEQSVRSGAEKDLITARELAQTMVSNCCTSDGADLVHVEESPRAGEMQARKNISTV